MTSQVSISRLFDERNLVGNAPPYKPQTMRINHLELVIDYQAHTLLSEHRFRRLWQTLYDNCPHATVFQAPEFVCTWYAEYRHQWQPVILYSQNSKEDIICLLLLAYNPTINTITHAGAHQAEYHVWLTLPNEDVSFLSAAWDELTKHFHFTTLRFKYLPNSLLGDTLKSVPSLHNKVIVRKCSRPLMNLTSDDMAASSTKKKKKSRETRFNRIKKLGTLEFCRITDAVVFEQVFEDLITFYDFRQGAINHATPFRQDVQKHGFHRDLFAAALDKIHFTVTYLNERPIAAFWGLISGKMVHVGMLVYSPFLSEHSPGKLHIMQLTDYLLQEGKYDVIDLTPGGDVWKEHYANVHDEVAEAIIYRSTFAKIRTEMLDDLLQWAKRCAATMNITPTKMRTVWAMLRKASSSAVIRKVRNEVSEDHELRIYRLNRLSAASFCCDDRIHCNSLSDLLSFEPSESSQSRDNFLSSALTRLEHRGLVYTINVDGHLAHYGWVAMNQATSYMTEAKPSMIFPQGSVCFYDFYSHPDFKEHGFYCATIGHMLHEAFADEQTEYVYISVMTDDLSSQHVIETMGFEYQGNIAR